MTFPLFWTCGSHRHGACMARDCYICHGPAADTVRPWLVRSGYTYHPDDGWHKVIRCREHTCRRDHKSGRIKAGDRYRVTTIRYIDDETGESGHNHEQRIISRRIDQ